MEWFWASVAFIVALSAYCIASQIEEGAHNKGSRPADYQPFYAILADLLRRKKTKRQDKEG